MSPAMKLKLNGFFFFFLNGNTSAEGVFNGPSSHRDA